MNNFPSDQRLFFALFEEEQNVGSGLLKAAVRIARLQKRVGTVAAGRY